MKNLKVDCYSPKFQYVIVIERKQGYDFKTKPYSTLKEQWKVYIEDLRKKVKE